MANTFGENLKKIRVEMDLSQEELARKLGTSKQVISRYEKNQRAPKITVASQYADILGVPLQELTGYEKSPAILEAGDDIRAIIAEKISSLPKSEQEDVLHYIDIRLQMLESHEE